MLRIGKLTDYGTLTMALLATEPQRLRSAPAIARQLRLEAPTVKKVLKPLEQAALLESRRGAHGGYRLARPPQDISLGAIIAALEGPLALTECADANGQCAMQAHCGQKPHWRAISKLLTQTFERITLADMIADQPTIPVAWVNGGNGRSP